MPECIADKPKTEDKDWQHHVIRIASQPPQPNRAQEHGEHWRGTAQRGNETTNHACFEGIQINNLNTWCIKKKGWMRPFAWCLTLLERGEGV